MPQISSRTTHTGRLSRQSDGMPRRQTNASSEIRFLQSVIGCRSQVMHAGLGGNLHSSVLLAAATRRERAFCRGARTLVQPANRPVKHVEAREFMRTGSVGVGKITALRESVVTEQGCPIMSFKGGGRPARTAHRSLGNNDRLSTPRKIRISLRDRISNTGIGTYHRTNHASRLSTTAHFVLKSKIDGGCAISSL